MSGFRLTIGKRIGLGFGVLIILLIVVFVMIYGNVSSGNDNQHLEQKLNSTRTTVYAPSILTLDRLSNAVSRSTDLIEIWVERAVSRDKPKKRAMLILSDSIIPAELTHLTNIKEFWNEEEKGYAGTIVIQVDSLLKQYSVITDSLLAVPSDYYDSYDSVQQKLVYSMNMLEVEIMVSEGDELMTHAAKTIETIEKTKSIFEEKAQKAQSQNSELSKQNNEADTTLLLRLLILGCALLFIAIIVGVFTTKSIVRPVRQLRNQLKKMGRGVIPDNNLKPTHDEIGEMSEALNSMVDGYRRTTEFSNQVGSGNFDYNYQPLSEEDALGHALLKMRDDLAENERILEQKVVERTEEVVRQRDEIERQRLKVEELYKDVTDSIRYAKRLQDSILPPERYIKELLPESFVLFKPKDIVSGDFYWFEKTEDKVLFAAVDCTGHGVPGAFMSLVGANALNQAVKEHRLHTPAAILDDLNKLSSQSLNKQNEENSVRDGMDLAMCAIDMKKLSLEYAGANNPLYIIRNNEIHITKADKFAIGSMTGETYTNHKIDLQKGDTIYVFSDGYADQFGGEKGKKFMYKKFRTLLNHIKEKPMSEQKAILNEEIEGWRGSFEQVDDILVIGVKI